MNLQTVRFLLAILTISFMILAGGCAQSPSVPSTSPTTPPVASAQPDQKAVLADNALAYLDLSYGPDPLQKLDVYAPKGLADAPVVIFVHGGEWARHDKAQVSFKPRFLNEHGIVFISTNYRLSPPARHPDHVNDVASAVAWVRGHITQYGGSPDKIFLMGHSAGCHLVTLASLDPRPLARVGLKPGDLRGVITWSGGAYDLVQRVRDGGMYASYIRKAFGEEESGWRDGSPVAHVTDAKPLPPYLFISIEANNPSHLASERLASLIRDAGGKAGSKLIKDRTHTTAIHLLGAPGDETGRILLNFIAEATGSLTPVK